MSAWLDEMRRQAGQMLDAFGLGPQETPSRLVAEWPGARMRAYHDPEQGNGPVLLIVPAPFKHTYIWDLLPQVSVIRRCRSGGAARLPARMARSDQSGRRLEPNGLRRPLTRCCPCGDRS